MSFGHVAALAFIAGMIIVSRLLRRRERDGRWDKEGWGFTPEHPEPGVKYRPFEVPSREPFD